MIKAFLGTSSGRTTVATEELRDVLIRVKREDGVVDGSNPDFHTGERLSSPV